MAAGKVRFFVVAVAATALLGIVGVGDARGQEAPVDEPATLDEQVSQLVDAFEAADPLAGARVATAPGGGREAFPRALPAHYIRHDTLRDCKLANHPSEPRCDITSVGVRNHIDAMRVASHFLRFPNQWDVAGAWHETAMYWVIDDPHVPGLGEFLLIVWKNDGQPAAAVTEIGQPGTVCAYYPPDGEFTLPAPERPVWDELAQVVPKACVGNAGRVRVQEVFIRDPDPSLDNVGLRSDYFPDRRQGLAVFTLPIRVAPAPLTL